MGTKTRSYPKFNPEADRTMAIFPKLVKILTLIKNDTFWNFGMGHFDPPSGLFSGPDRVPSGDTFFRPAYRKKVSWNIWVLRFLPIFRKLGKFYHIKKWR